MVQPSELDETLVDAAGAVTQKEDWSVEEEEWSRVLNEEQLSSLEEAPQDAELWAKRLGQRAARLERAALHAALQAAAAPAATRLANRLTDAATAATNLRARHAKLDAILCAAAPAPAEAARRPEAAQRVLLSELEKLFQWLEADGLAESETAPDLNTASGRARALSSAKALRSALKGGPNSPALRRLAATTERLRKLTRAKDRLSASLGRHLNNLLIHLGNEAGAAPPAPLEQALALKHHAELLPYAPFMRWLKEMDEKAYEALLKLYSTTWSRVYERAIQGWCETAKTLNTDTSFDQVLTQVETLCDLEQDFSTQFFSLDVDVKAESEDGERSEKSSSGGGTAAGGRRGAGGGGGGGGAGGEARRLQGELLPALDAALTALVTHRAKREPYGSMRALAVASRHIVTEPPALPSPPGAPAPAPAPAPGAPAPAPGEARWRGGAAAAAAIAAKRHADKLVAELRDNMQEHCKLSHKKHKCGILGFLPELEEFSQQCEQIFGRDGRRADLERWYHTLAAAASAAIAGAAHPRTPTMLIQCENYHRLQSVIAAWRVATLDAVRRDARARYNAALLAYTQQYYARPLDRLQLFFERVSEALAAGVRASEVAYRPHCSKHELRRLLALYPPAAVRDCLRRLYRAVEKQASPEAGLLQVLWRAIQEELLKRHAIMQARMAECYPGSGLSMPVSTQDLLDAFSDIAQEH